MADIVMGNEFQNIDVNSGYMYTPTIISLILSGTSAFAIKNTSFESNPLVLGGFSLLLSHGLLGVFLYGHPKHSSLHRLHRIYSLSTLFVTATPLALLNTELCLKYNINYQTSYGHLFSSIIPILMNAFTPRNHEKILDLIMLGNIASLGYLSILYDNYWMIGLTFICGINHFVLNRLADVYDVQKANLTTIGFSLFNIMALNSITTAIAPN